MAGTVATVGTAAATAIEASHRFRRIITGISVAPFKAELLAAEALWATDTSRQDGIPAHQDTETIFLRCADRLKADQPTRDIQTSRYTPQARHFPALLRFLHGIAEALDGDLGRVLIIRLRPGGQVGEHIDLGAYYSRRQRYHLVVAAATGSVLRCGGEDAILREGELWWFDNKAPHSAENNADSWRVHVVFDVRTAFIAPGDREGPTAPDPATRIAEDLASGTGLGSFDPVETLHRIWQLASRRLRRLSTESEALRVKLALLGMLRAKAVIRATDGETAEVPDLLQSRAGRRWSWMVDSWPVLLNGTGARLCACGFWDLCDWQDGPLQIAGPALSAVPLLTAILTEGERRGRSVTGLVVRTDRPEHGTGRLIEGTITGSTAILVDDLLNSGQSLETARSALLHRGVSCRQAFCLVDFRSEAGLTWRRQADLSVDSLFTLTELGLPPVSRKGS